MSTKKLQEVSQTLIEIEKKMNWSYYKNYYSRNYTAIVIPKVAKIKISYWKLFCSSVFLFSSYLTSHMKHVHPVVTCISDVLLLSELVQPFFRIGILKIINGPGPCVQEQDPSSREHFSRTYFLRLSIWKII